MPLQIYSPPINCYEMVSQNLEYLNILVQAKQEEKQLEMTKPLPMYDVHFSDELKKGSINPKLTGWRCFVAKNNEAISMADIVVHETGENPEFLYFTKGDIVEKVLSKICEIESLDVVKKDHFEVRLLRISSVNLLAIWLHGSNQELIYPIDKKLSENEPYTFSQISENITEQLKSIDEVGPLTPPQ
jgi:hypothetical protein